MRKPREYEPGLPHHVWFRGNNRRILFADEEDLFRFTHYVAQAAKATKSRIHGAVFMRNHAHLVMTPLSLKGMSSCIKRACQRYALVRNRRRTTTGKLFEQGYSSRLIKTDDDLGVCLAYAENNPVRARLVKKPASYFWSTHALHLGDTDHPFAEFWSPHEWYLRLGARRYGQLVSQIHVDGTLPEHGDVTPVAPRFRRRIRRPDGSSAR